MVYCQCKDNDKDNDKLLLVCLHEYESAEVFLFS